MTVYWWNPMYDDYDNEDGLTRKVHVLNNLPCVNAGGNVGAACWVFAHAVLRKKRVGLVGMDFGYYPDTPYLQTQYYKEILELVGPDRLEEVYVRLFNPHMGQQFYTDPAYLWYRDAFLEMAQEAEDTLEREVGIRQARDASPCVVGDEPKKQLESISIAADR